MRRLKQFCVLCLLVFLFSACSASSTEKSDGEAAQSMVAQMPQEDFIAEMPKEAMAPSVQEATDVAVPRKRIQTGALEMQVDDLASAQEQAETLAKDFAGYVENSWIEKSNAFCHAELTLRVDAERFTEAMEALKQLGEVQSAHTQTDDITQQYIDTDARLKTLGVQEERLLALLENAETIEDLLAIETQLQEVREEIERTTATLKSLDSQVQYATISLSLQTRTTVVSQGFFGKLKARIAEGMNDSLNILNGLLAGLIVLLPWAALAALLIALLYKLWSRRHASRKRNAGIRAPQIPSDAPRGKTENGGEKPTEEDRKVSITNENFTPKQR